MNTAKLFPCLWLCMIGLVWGDLQASQQSQSFSLKPVPVLQLEPALRSSLARGVWVICQDNAYDAIKTLPPLRSFKPQYGQVRVGEKTYTFVLDQANARVPIYNRLILDQNLDGDLSNDRVLLPLKQQPLAGRLNYPFIQVQGCFDIIHVPAPFEQAQEKPLAIMPRVIQYPNQAIVTFVTAWAHQGVITVNRQRFRAVLAHSGRIPGWYDKPEVALHLICMDAPFIRYWQGANQLKTWHTIGGDLFHFAASPDGQILTVFPYHGPFGTFQVGAGTRSLERINFQGALEGEDRIVPVGANVEKDFLKPVNRFEVPVGDYMPKNLTVEYGTLRVDLRQNPHSEGHLDSRQGRANVYGIHIREHTPFVLDFSRTPDVVFASPGPGDSFSPGQTIEIKAMLVDPKLDMLFRNLEKLDYSTETARSRARGESMDPTVVVTGPDGRKVAEGTMPFG